VSSARGGPALGGECKDMFYVYILKNNKTGKLYKGFTSNLKRRILEHKKHQPIYTGNNGEWSLIYYEAFLNKKDAQNEEKFLKSGKGRERIKYLFEE
jgi:putative endonuclease